MFQRKPLCASFVLTNRRRSNKCIPRYTFTFGYKMEEAKKPPHVFIVQDLLYKF